MTREEAIKILKFQRGYFCDFKECQEQQAFTMAIKALEQEPKTDTIDKIRAEIDAHREMLKTMADDDWYAGKIRGYDCTIEIIDKYKTGSEE